MCNWCADHRKYWWLSVVVLAQDMRRFLSKVWGRSILQTYNIFHPNCDINMQVVLHFLPPQSNIMVSLLTYVCQLFNVCSCDLWRPCCLSYKLHQRDNLSAIQCNRFYDNMCFCASLNSLSSVASIVLVCVLQRVDVTFFALLSCVWRKYFLPQIQSVVYLWSFPGHEFKYTAMSKNANIQPCQKFVWIHGHALNMDS